MAINDTTFQYNVGASVGVDLDELNVAERERILVVDDEIDTILLLKQILRIAGFNVLSASSGKEALTKFVDYQPDLVLLDLMMPEMDGWETLKHFRQIVDNVPVIIVSALGSKEDVVKGLRAGADDYVSKPFYNAEVTERVKTVLKRSAVEKEISHLVFPQIGMELDLKSQEVTIEDVSIRLTPKEFAVLSLLAKHAPAIVSYETIAETIWETDNLDIRKRIKYLIYLLRRKFEEIQPENKFILNVDRLGYKLQTEV